MIKLSIITINYNDATGLKKTLDSVASQTYPHIEHIIVDGGSTDNSVKVICEYESTLALSPHRLIASRLKWISEKDTGIYNAMNKGLEIALGRRVVTDDHTSLAIADSQSPIVKTDYIQILNSGDILAAPDVTERMMAALQAQQAKGERLKAKGMMDEAKGERLEVRGMENGEADIQAFTPYTLHPTPTDASRLENCPAILYGNMIKEYPDGRRAKDTCGCGDYTPESFYYFYRGTLNHDCAYIRRDLFEKYGLYNEEMKICSDWEWYVRAIVLGGEKTVYTNIDVTVFDMTGISESNGKNKDIILKERREYLESILPAAVLRDYDMFSLPIEQYRRLKKYHLWGVVYFVERVLFKLEKWGFLRR
ncbi:MAG: glycosyltransferase [Paludibacteraceae bacterium]|nr:glycosyltransferase [Paludibacteraceae bacterium]